MENRKEESNKVKNDSFSVGKIFWGLLFILFGALILAENFGWASVNWEELWRLWPLMIIAAGLSILSINRLIWRIFAIFLAIISIIAITWVAIGTYSVPSFDKEIQFDKNGIHIFVRS